MDNLFLKPCPFCGGKAQLRDGHIYMDETVIAECTKCHVRSLPVFIDHPNMTVGGVDEATRYTKDRALQIAQRNWNRRIEGALSDLPGWHDFRKDPPTDEKSILTVNGHGEIRMMAPYMLRSMQHDGKHKWLYEGRVFFFNDILYWMPLPKPPKEVKRRA